MKWFKFYGQDYLSDPKMLSLTACERSCWLTLLSYSSINDNGMITFMSEQQLMLQSGLDFQDDSWDRTVGVLKKLERLEMITVDNEVITVKNWGKRQETNLTSYERVKRYRQKKHNDNTKITLDKKRIEENRRDKNIILESTPAQEAKSFFDGNVETIFNEFKEKSSLNSELLKTEFQKFILYWTEKNKSGTKQRWEQQSTFEVRRRLATWLGKMKDFKNNKNQPNYIL